MTRYKVWDPLVRVFHWSLAALFLANLLITDPDGQTHAAIGYALATLVAFRVLWGFIGPHFARFAEFWPSGDGVIGQVSDMIFARAHIRLGHTPLGALMILNLLASIAALALTGHLMTLDAFPGDALEEVHEILVGWAALSVCIHVAAVIWESHRLHVNLTRAMITGVKTVPEGASVSE